MSQLPAVVKAEITEVQEVCTWLIDIRFIADFDGYRTSCEHGFEFNFISEHLFKFCPFCGKEIQRVEIMKS